MLLHPVIQQLRTLKLDGMALALQEQQEQPSIREFSLETLLLDRERAIRDAKGMQRRLVAARLKLNVSIEEVDFKHPRGLDAKLLRSLQSGQWIAEKRGVIITGPTGVGKTFIGCALAHQACRQGFTALYAQTGLLQEMTLAKGDGRYLKLLASLAKVNVLILDDWGLDLPTVEGRKILLEILDDRYKRALTIITSQFPTSTWHANLGDPTLADAILDRVLHNADRIDLKGKSLQKKSRQLTQETVSLS